MNRLGMLILFLFWGISLMAIEKSPMNVLKNWDFENGRSFWASPGWISDTLAPLVDSSFSKDSGHSIKFIAEKGKEAWLMQSGKHNPQVNEYKLSGWIKAENISNFQPSLVLEIVYTENNATKFKYDGIYPNIKTTSDWFYVEKIIPVPKTTKDIRILLRTSSNPAISSSGNVWFDCIELQEIISQGNSISIREAVPGGDFGLFAVGESPCMHLSVINSFAEDKKVEISFSVSDYFNNKIYEKKENALLSKLAATRKKLELQVINKQGFYSVHITLNVDNIPIASSISSFVVYEPIDTPDPFFGFSWIGLPVENIKTVRKIGAGTVGVFMPRRIEYQKDKYDWGETDFRVNECIAHGLKMIGGFHMFSGNFYLNPPWIIKKTQELKSRGENINTEDYYKGFADFEQKVVERYAKHINEWSACSEIDLRMKYERDLYIRTVKDLHSIIKKANPSFELGGIGVSGCDGVKKPRFPIARELWKELHPYLDIMAFDPYTDSARTFGPGYKPIGEENANFREILLEALEIIKPYGKKFISIDEKGYDIVSDSPLDSKYNKQMAQTLARGFIIAKSVSENKHWLYFLFSGAQHGVLDWGLWIKNCPRPAAASYAAVARRLAHATVSQLIEIHKDIQCYIFKKGTVSVATLWTLKDEPMLFKMNLPADFAMYDIMNNRTIMKKGDKWIKLSSDPIFIESDLAPDNLAETIKKAYFTLPQIKGVIRLKSLSSFSVDIINQINEDIKVEIKPELNGMTIYPTEKKVDIKAYSAINADFNIEKSSYATLCDKVINVEIIVNGNTKYPLSAKLDILPVTKIKRPVEIDGDLSEFKGIKPIILDNAAFIYPSHSISAGLWTGESDLTTKVYLAYDDKNFYFAAEVKDDNRVNTKEGFSIWENDSFQIAFDTENDAVSNEMRGITGYDVNDYEFGLSITPKGTECFCYTAGAPNKTMENTVTPFKVSIKPFAENITLYELAIPRDALLPLKLKPGTVFNFSFMNFDADYLGQPPYGMQLTPGICNGKNPSQFKTFVLMP
ncbi:MAG: hypothetical protein A4E71_00137 [Smithella sp. PtaU1.Bin162]|nr:MAG: hypothetical protein A4E71_00137 [Smithella sp. PtaU1.Bin162]